MPAWGAGPGADDDGHEKPIAGGIDPVTVGAGGPKNAARPVARTGLVAPKKPRPKAGRKALAERPGKLDLGTGKEYQIQPLELLDKGPDRSPGDALNKDALQQNARFLGGVLEDFGVRGEIVKVRPGPVIILSELEPAPCTKTSLVIVLSSDIARSMSAVSARRSVVRVLAALAQSPLSQIYRGEQISMNRPVTLKIIQVSDKDWARRYLDAVYASGQLVHHNSALIFDTGEENKKYYVVREYVGDKAPEHNTGVPGPVS